MTTPKTPATSTPATGNAALASPIAVPAQSQQDEPAMPPLQVMLMRSAASPTDDQALWTAIRNRSEALSFDRYLSFIYRVLCTDSAADSAVCGNADSASAMVSAIASRRAELAAQPGIYGPDAFQLLKMATSAYLRFASGIAVRPPQDPRTGTIVTTPPPPGSAPEPNSVYATIPGEASRLGRSITYNEAQEALTTYLQSQVGGIGGVALPYLKRVAHALLESGSPVEGGMPWCDELLHQRMTCPMAIELIYSYWCDEAALSQAMNAIMLRFQNRRTGPSDPLGPLTLSPLRPMSNLLWGCVQDVPNQLSVARLGHEYEYEYGFSLRGRAADDLAPVESRTQFIEFFHRLLQQAVEFYKADANTTVVADGFNVLQTLKQLHVVLAMSANNQVAELKLQARVEALCKMYLLSRPEMGEFLRGRPMVPYPARYIAPLEDMWRLFGWGPEGQVSHFHNLSAFGETLLLTIRWADWSVMNDHASAVNWLRFFRPEIQSYIHSYQAVTGVDLGAGDDSRKGQLRFVPPSTLLAARRCAHQRPALARRDLS